MSITTNIPHVGISVVQVPSLWHLRVDSPAKEAPILQLKSTKVAPSTLDNSLVPDTSVSRGLHLTVGKKYKLKQTGLSS